MSEKKKTKRPPKLDPSTEVVLSKHSKAKRSRGKRSVGASTYTNELSDVVSIVPSAVGFETLDNSSPDAVDMHSFKSLLSNEAEHERKNNVGLLGGGRTFVSSYDFILMSSKKK